MDFGERRRAFKQTQDLDEVRRKREDEEVQLRKSEKQGLLQKKRQAITSCQGDHEQGGSGLTRSIGLTEEDLSNSVEAAASVAGATALIGGSWNPELANMQALARVLLAEGVADSCPTTTGSAPSPPSEPPGALLPGTAPPTTLGSEQAGGASCSTSPRGGAGGVPTDVKSRMLQAATEIRKRLSRTKDPPINDVIDNGLVPRMVKLMLQTDDHKFKFELAWALTNVASGEPDQTAAVVSAGGMEAFLSILNSRSALKPELCEQCVWALGNIAGDGPALRDQLLEKNVMTILQNICSAIYQLPWTDKEKTDVLRNVMWLMSNLCRGKPAPPFSVVLPAFDVFAEVVGRNLDRDMSVDSMWGLSYLTQTSNEQEDSRRCRQLLLSGQANREELAGGCNLLMKCLVNIIRYGSAAGGAANDAPVGEIPPCQDDTNLMMPALRVAGNVISAADPLFTDVCISSGIIPALVSALTNPGVQAAVKLRKEVFWVISNIAAGTPAQIRSLAEKFPASSYQHPGCAQMANPATSSIGPTGTPTFPPPQHGVAAFGGLFAGAACAAGSPQGGEASGEAPPITSSRPINMFDLVHHEIRQTSSRNVKHECAHCFSNAISAGDRDMVEELIVGKNVFKLFADFFKDERDPKTLEILLDATTGALRSAGAGESRQDAERRYVDLAEQADMETGLQRIVNEFKEAEGCCQKAHAILDRWFC
eukprot:CAMPEP_0178987538 /NCGR_PEP_ID=MMETSP0795-20121207/3318_1 /TAXON_ID=88552 /ORGANISM="Amoebophrya sp., Strain Ameob2" /LENGTH=707 /DNA_ID=CAMNT_0020678727 /DNA_START=125 /DNA_END=2245 /DNA_ORIENTATION=-